MGFDVSIIMYAGCVPCSDLMLPGVVLPSSGGHSVEGVARGEGVAIELAETRLVQHSLHLVTHENGFRL